MKKINLIIALLIIGAGIFFLSKKTMAENYPKFTLAWSEYPSWSAFGVLHEAGLLNGREGKLGSIEKKYKVDIVLEEMDYDSTIQLYASGKADAVCITNMDILSPSLSLDSVAILPTSTSNGADALIVTDKIKSLNDLKGVKVAGLDLSVSSYTFDSNLELQGANPDDFKFVNMDPGVAALQFQQGQLDAIVVWNPFVLDTLEKLPTSRVMFDSTTIPGEIIDMVVANKESLASPGGVAFAHAVIDSFYELNKLLADPAEGDSTLIALGEKFSNLGLQSMRKVVKQTKFYATPEAAITLFESEGLQTTMNKVVKYCVKRGIVDSAPTVSFGGTPGNVMFDASYIKNVLGK